MSQCQLHDNISKLIRFSLNGSKDALDKDLFDCIEIFKEFLIHEGYCGISLIAQDYFPPIALEDLNVLPSLRRTFQEM